MNLLLKPTNLKESGFERILNPSPDRPGAATPGLVPESQTPTAGGTSYFSPSGSFSVSELLK